ncbi:uncharacterized protein LOC131651221 [Vicia villosa]|uniref:uncharacterized protein LOC131651221 n=1 Tax=Vicia villosa TaxID=3911 RepID=UPI00273C667D|nr:uncharacterized protein LOC131651221 [Vicia villosa]
MEGSSVKRSRTTVSRCEEERVEIQGISKRTRSCVLKQMLEELRAVKKESMAAIEEIEEYTVKKEADVEEELPDGLERDALEREEIAVRCKKGKRKEQAQVSAGGHGRKTYHASVYRASFQSSATRRTKSYSGLGKQNGKGAAAAMSNDGGRMRREVKEKASISGTAGNGERRTRQRKYHGVTNASRDGGADTYLEKVKGKAKVVGMKVKTEPVVEEDDTRGPATNVLEEKGKGVAAEGVRRREEQVIVSERGRKRPLVVLSSDSESCDTQNAEEEEVVKYDEVIEEDDGIYGTVFQWRRKMSGRVVQRNVLQLPQKVIKKCLMTGHERIQIADSDTGIDYDCVLHRAVRRYGVERFLGEGWYDFAKSRDIKRGDRIGFSLRVPPTSKIVVSILNR